VKTLAGRHRGAQLLIFFTKFREFLILLPEAAGLSAKSKQFTQAAPW